MQTLDFVFVSGLHILGDPGADSGDEGKSKRSEKYGTKKSKERREEPLGKMSYQTSSKRLPPFWLLIGARKTQDWCQTNQKPDRRRPFGTGLVRHCPQGLFSPFFTFLCAIFFRPFRLSLVPTICPWVSEDGVCITVSNSPNLSRVYIRLCKHGKRFLLLNSLIDVDWLHTSTERQGCLAYNNKLNWPILALCKSFI